MSTAEYRNLLAKYVPQPIRSAADYRRALAQIERLMTPHPDRARSLLIEVLGTLIEKYESRLQPTRELAPPAMLAHLIEAKRVKSVDVAKATGIPPATLSNVLAGRRDVSKQNAFRLGKYFGVSPLFFLTAAKSAPRRSKANRAAAG